MGKFDVGDLAVQCFCTLTGMHNVAEVLHVNCHGGLTVKDIKSGTVYGWAESMCECIPKSLITTFLIQQQPFFANPTARNN
jgi:hypothetical protein